MIIGKFLYTTSPRYYFIKILRRIVRMICDVVPDVALIAACTALFILIWARFFIK